MGVYGRTASKKREVGGIEWKTPGTSLSFCSLMGCRTSGIDQQVGKFDTRQWKSVREAEREKKEGARDKWLTAKLFPPVFKIWVVRWKGMLFQTPRLSVHMWLWMHLHGFMLFSYNVFITFCPLFPNYVLLCPLNPENVNTHASIVYLNLSTRWRRYSWLIQNCVGGLGGGLNAPIVSLSGSSHKVDDRWTVGLSKGLACAEFV